MAGRWAVPEVGLMRPLRSRLRGTGGESARRRRRRMEARRRLMLQGAGMPGRICWFGRGDDWNVMAHQTGTHLGEKRQIA